MAPIKFEDNLKEKLEQRTLQPSKNAWEKLNSQIEANQEKKNNKTFWWFGIAASFIGVLIISSVFFNKKDDSIIEQNVVNTEEIQKPKSIDKTITPNKIETLVVLEESQTEKTNNNIIDKSSGLKPQSQQKLKEQITQTPKDVVAQVETETPNNIHENIIKSESVLSYEDIKLQEVVAQVQELKKANNQVSDAEINALLDQAQKDITLYKLYNESTKKVDANALLQDVEADLDQSFRERAFIAIKSGYNFVKTTVAERNN